MNCVCFRQMVDNLRGWLFGLIGIDTLCPLKDQFGFVKLVNQFGACIRFLQFAINAITGFNDEIRF